MIRKFGVLWLVAVFTGSLPLPAQEAEADMTTKVFKVPFNFIGSGNQVIAVPPPKANPFATARPKNWLLADVPEFKSSQEILEATGVEFPPGAHALFDPVTQELTVHNTRAAHDLTEAFIHSIPWEGDTPTLAFTLTLVEGPGEVIRQANAASSSIVEDATRQLEALLAEAAKPGSRVQVVGEMFLETKAGTHAAAEAALERPVMGGFRSTAAAAPTLLPATEPPTESSKLRPSWTRQDGMKLELESFFDAKRKTLGGIFSLLLGPEPPELEGAGGRQPTPDRRHARFEAALHMMDGCTKLIGITKPTGKTALKSEGKDILQAALLTSRVRRLKSPLGMVAGTDIAKEQLPSDMREVALKMPDRLAKILVSEAREATQLGQPQRTKEHGIFPKESAIEPQNGGLRIVNTPENIEIIAAVADHAWAKAPHSVALTLHTFQVPAAFMRTLMQESRNKENVDDSAMLAAVETATTRSETRFVSSTSFEGKSGVRSRHESGVEHSLLTNFDTEPSPVERELGFMQQVVGEIFEIEPTVGPGGRTVDFLYTHEMHPKPPSVHRELLRTIGSAKDHDVPGVKLQVLRTKATVSMASGTTKLLSLHSVTPETDEADRDTLWATFLQIHVVPQAGTPKPPPLTKEEAAKVRLIEKMNKLILPEVSLKEATLEKAIDYLRIKAREADTSTNVAGEKGVNLILPPDDIPSGNTSITLDLKDVPFAEALRYVSELGHKRYLVKAHGVLVIHPHYGIDEMHTRTYRVMPDFISISEEDRGTTPADPFAAPRPADPFAPMPTASANTSNLNPRETAKRILMNQGIMFPEGASASYIPGSSTLVVRNTRPNLDLVEMFCEWSCRNHANFPVVLTAQVLQGPGPLLRRIAAKAAPLNDHRAMLEELLAAIKTGTVQPLDTARIETQCGTSASTEQGHTTATLTGLVLDGKGAYSPQYAPLFAGLSLELGPSIGIDGISLNLRAKAESHTAAPQQRQEHLIDDHGRRIDFTLTAPHRARLTTEIPILDGSTRLLHLWKPTGRPEFEKEDILQVMFITCDMPRPEE